MGDGSGSVRVAVWSMVTSVVLHAIFGWAGLKMMPGSVTALSGDGVAWRGDDPGAMVWLREPEPVPEPKPPEPPAVEAPKPEIPPLPAVVEPPRKLTLGEDAGDPTKDTLISSDRTEEHAAKPSTIEQPALSPAAGGGGVPAAPGDDGAEAKPDASEPPRASEPITPPPTPAPVPPTSPTALIAPAPASKPAEIEPKEEREAKPETVLPAPVGVGVEAKADPSATMVPEKREGEIGAAEQAKQDAQTEVKEVKGEKSDKDLPRSTEEDLLAIIADLLEPEATNAEAGKLIVRPEPATPPPAPPGARGAPGKAGPPVKPGPGGTGDPKLDDASWLSEKVSDAVSLRRAAQYENGKVTAGQGIELVVTRRPEHTTFTRLRGAARNPAFDIVFDRSGVVKDVIVVRGSGNRDLDEDIRNAIHFWKARGKDLALIGERADATMTVRLTVLLLGG